MPKPKKGARLGSNPAHQKLLLSTLAKQLFLNEAINTTEAKAKMLRSFADSTITWSTSVQALIAKGDKATPAEKAKILHARRQARLTVKTPAALQRLFSEIGPHFASRKGGYTRVLKTRVRKGDAAPMAFVELVGLAPQANA